MRLSILAFALAIIWLQFQPALPDWWPLAAAVGVVAAAGGAALKRTRLPLAILAGALIGIAWASWRAEGRLADALPVAWEGRDIELTGVVAELPQTFEQGSRFRFAVEAVHTPQAVVPADLMLSWYRGRRDGEDFAGKAVRAGERWRLTVRLKRPHGNANPHGFDYEVWLLERGIRATGYVRPDNAAERVDEMVWRPGYAIERWRDQIRQSFQAVLPEAKYPYAGVLVALAIGDQRAIHGDLWNVFNRTGTTHLMAISGSHVTMVGVLAAWLVGWSWRRVPRLMLRLPAQRAAIIAGLLAALLYALVAGFAVPAQRTVYMLVVAALALYSGRRLAPSRVLCLALLVVLLIDPWAVLAAGFWLSFGAVGALLWIGTARVEGRGWGLRLRQWSAVQWAATVASLPVLLLVFQQFSLVSPFANAVAIPFITFVVTPLTLLAALVPWWPLLELAHGLLALLMAGLEWAAQWPVWQVAAPPLWAGIAAALGAVLLLLPGGIGGRGAGAVLLLPALLWSGERPPDGEAWVDVLDVGQGLAAVVRTRQHTLLYDTGPLYSAESDAGQRVIVPYLRALGVNRLDALMLTHRDADHSGGLASVRAAMPVGSMLSSLPELRAEECVAGQNWEWDGVRFSVLHPVAADYRAGGKANHLSCVLKIEAGGRSMLFTSDIEARDEAALLARDRPALAADIALVPHHGSRTSSTPDFLDAVGAREAIIPVGYRNRFGHPKDDVVARHADTSHKIWRTDRDGAVRVKLGEKGMATQGWRNLSPRYWHKREY